ncbi:RE1-silencing transcription factor A like protein [Argiope bruennichi]|uniref:RE1-silencing transcription factor A like protein n=2 Tax=Argiope bruennichi TaxID=94029 RepID=A0A8T0G3Q6_ARGBR|nr:RE1-silencing transcription factor A like protein [Argiope bruennichi]
MFCLDWKSGWDNQFSNKEASYFDVPSFLEEQNAVKIAQPNHGSIKEEIPDESFNIYGQISSFKTSSAFDDWAKPQYKLSDSTSSHSKSQFYRSNSTSPNYWKHQPESNNVISDNTWSKRHAYSNISVTKNNSTSFKNLKCQSIPNNPITSNNSTSVGFLKCQSGLNSSILSNNFKHQPSSNNAASSDNLSNCPSISNISMPKINSTTFNSSSNNFITLNNISLNELKFQPNSNYNTVSSNSNCGSFPNSITSSSELLESQSSSKKFSSTDSLKFKPTSNNFTLSNDFLKHKSPTYTFNESEKWSSSELNTNTFPTANDLFNPPPGLSNSALTCEWMKYLSNTDDTTIYNDCIEPQLKSNNCTVDTISHTSYPISNNFSANNNYLSSESNNFVRKNAWLEPETNSNNSVTWLMPEPNPDCEILTPQQQLTTIKQECDVKPVLTELKTAKYDSRDRVFCHDDIQILPSPGTEYIFNSSPEELLKICGIDDLIQTSTEEFLITSDVDDIISGLNATGIKSETPVIKEESIIKEETVNQHFNKEPNSNVKLLKILPTLNRKYFKCPQCIYNTNTREHLDEHINKIHSCSNIYKHNMLSNNRVKPHNGKTKTVGNGLQESLITSKSSDCLYKCSRCKYKTRRIDRYQKHKEEKTCEKFSDMDDIWLKASKTSNTTAGKETPVSKRSSTYNTKSKPNKCNQCSYSSNRSDCLQKHIEKVHSKSICYKCNMCTFQSNYNKEYYEHVKSHYVGPPFVCDVCSYKSKLITAFVAHRVIHSGDRLFCCTLCAFSCKRKYHLKGHMISHSREKNFTCKYCFKKYSYKCSLVRHLKTACRVYAPDS